MCGDLIDKSITSKFLIGSFAESSPPLDPVIDDVDQNLLVLTKDLANTLLEEELEISDMFTSDSEDVCWPVENNLFVEEETLQPIVTAIGDELPVDYEVVRDQMVTCSAKKTPLFEGYSVDIDNAHTQKYSRIVEESSETLAALDDKEMNQLFLVKRSFNDSDDDGSLDNNYVKRLASVEIKDLISGFEDVFDPVLADELPMNRKFDCAIDLIPGSKLPYGPIYKTTLEESRLIKEFLDENLSKGFIRHSISTISSPGFLVPKKDGSKRFVVNYGKLNDITVKVRYPLPLIDSILQQLSKATVFTSLDLKGAYNLVRMNLKMCIKLLLQHSLVFLNL